MRAISRHTMPGALAAAVARPRPWAPPPAGAVPATVWPQAGTAAYPVLLVNGDRMMVRPTPDVRLSACGTSG
jgi:hypothetical protein